MSAYKRIECSLVDKETLLGALKKLGLEPRVTIKAEKLQGYRGDERIETAEIIVPRTQLNKKLTGVSNDLGFKWNPSKKQYEMICSEYDMGVGLDSRVKQAYAAVALEKVLLDNRFDVEIDIDSLANTKRTQLNIIATKVI